MENMQNTKIVVNEQNIIDQVKKNLSKLSLPAEWAAKQIRVTGGYLRKIFSGDVNLTLRIKEKLIELNRKLEQMAEIFKAA